MLRCCTFSCTSTHTSCYAAARSLALPHIRHATLLRVLLHFHTYVMLRCCTFSCASTHTSCYAAARSLALPHIRHAMLLHVFLHFHTYVMLRCCTSSCTSTHTSCYEPEELAMLMLAKLGQEPSNNKCLKWQNVAHNCGEFVKQLGGSPQKRVLLWPERRLWTDSGMVKSTIPLQLNTHKDHKDCRQDFRKNWKYLYAAVWRKSVKGNVLKNLGQLCA